MSAAWLDQPLLAFDTETTGVDPTAARIVTATVVWIQPDTTVAPQTWLLDPGIPIPDEAAAIHGITTEVAAAQGIPAKDGVRDIAGAVAHAISEGVPVVAYNACYDLTVLDHELARHGHPPLSMLVGGPVRPVIDPMVIDRAIDRYRRGKRTLSAACEHYRVRLDGAHDSTADALAAARVAWRIATVSEQVAGMTVEELHDAQVGWHATWAEGFESYLRSQGKDERIDGTWPYRPARSQVAA